MRILVVDDESSMRQYLEVLFGRHGYAVSTAASVREATSRLAAGEVDLVVSDMRLGKESGLTVLRAARERSDAPEVILITAFGTPETAVQAMREGAYDYICKPFDNDELVLLVQKALEKRVLQQENRRLRESLHERAGSALLGTSPGMARVRELISKVAASRTTVLITGESGTGKELVARSIHAESPRSGQPFLPVNCAAIAEGILESELFGHVKGSFTGASSDRSGILVAAGEGTVFLDEIGEVPPSFQVKLLRVLQERRVKPVGSTAEQPFQARVLAATNRSLEKDVKEGRFREDLFYRLNVIAVDVPPLRERPEDIVVLAEHFLAGCGAELGRVGLRFTSEALACLRRYAFPGNVRQLQNVVERAATLGETAVLGPEMLPAALRGEAEVLEPAVGVRVEKGFNLERHLDTLERQLLLSALREAGGVKTRAAELLSLTFRSFRYRLAKHGLGESE